MPNGSLAPVADPPRYDDAGDVAVCCRELVVRYGELTAVDGVSFTALRGQVLALLGPNGAGKTSTVETLEGYRRPSGGSVRVLGLDPVDDHRRLVPRIGVMLQRGGIYPTATSRQVLTLFSRLYDDPEDPRALIELVGLQRVARTPWRQLSGGEQQRLSLALALVGRPEVVFLDEPTAGVDPEGRIAIRQVVASLRERGVCVVLTTHELPEAEKLADQVVIIQRGRVVARGTPAELAGGGHGMLRFSAPPGIDTEALAVALALAASAVTEVTPGEYRVEAEATPERVAALTSWLAARNLPLGDLRAGRRTLEDAYLEAVGSADDGREGTR